MNIDREVFKFKDKRIIPTIFREIFTGFFVGLWILTISYFRRLNSQLTCLFLNVSFDLPDDLIQSSRTSTYWRSGNPFYSYDFRKLADEKTLRFRHFLPGNKPYLKKWTKNGKKTLSRECSSKSFCYLDW